MYNSIYPININYRKPNPYEYQGRNQNTSHEDTAKSYSAPQNDTYVPSSNQINISQILMDFRNTILAINAPKDVQDEVGTYLQLVDKESKKENPSRDIIISNLRNASKISDLFITSALGKQSNVVEGWITTIFRQNINLKSNPDEINPDFLLKFPAKAEERINNAEKQEIQNTGNVQLTEEPVIQEEKETETESEAKEELKVVQLPEIKTEEPQPKVEVFSSIDTVQSEDNIFLAPPPRENIRNAFSANNENDERAKVLYSQAKKIAKTSDDLKDALNMLNEALGYLNDESNSNIKAAIHFERGKIFDEYDYVDYALRDYYEATKADDLNLKANAYYKSGSLYDEFREFDPALNNYLSSVAYSGEADNLSAQSKVLSKISGMYARIFDTKNTHDYADLAIDSALDSNNPDAIANTYSSVAQNYQYLGDSKDALENYKNALAEFSRHSESYDEMAYNYSQAAIVMRELGNEAKAEKLQQRANLYYQRAQLQQEQLAQAS